MAVNEFLRIKLILEINSHPGQFPLLSQDIVIEGFSQREIDYEIKNMVNEGLVKARDRSSGNENTLWLIDGLTGSGKRLIKSNI